MSNTELKKYLLDNIDAEEVYSYLFPEWKEDENISCPFAADRHEKGTDKSPSMSIDFKKGVYCHACGYKASSFIGLYEDMHSLSFDNALKEVYSKFIRPLVLVQEYKRPAKSLLNNPLILSKIFEKRGLDKSTIKKWRLGWWNDRLLIPIFNEFDHCINIRKHDILNRHAEKYAKIISHGKKKDGFGEPILFPLASLRGNVIYLLEGELDSLLMLQHGFSALTVTGGATTWLEEWSVLFAGKRVVILPDNDKAGMDGALKKQNAINKAGGSAVLLELPVQEKGEDITDWFLKYNGTSGDLRKMAKERLKGKPESSKEESENGNGERFDLLETTLTPKEIIMLERSNLVYSELNSSGAFFKNNYNSMFYVQENGKVIPVGMSSVEYQSYMSRLSPIINIANSSGRFILQHVINQGHLDSQRVKTGNWTLLNKGRLYIYENKNNLIKLTETSSSRIPNAINDDSILLEYPYNQMAFKFSGKANMDSGIKTLWHSFAENIALNNNDRMMLICWLLGIFMREYVQARPLIRLLAKTSWSKSTVSRMISLFIYGDDLLSHSASTIAASYEMSRTHPLLIFDNIETRNMTQSFEDFMLIASTGGLKAKRQKMTDSGIVIDSANCLLLTNGIEPFNKRELISRTIELNLDLEKYGKSPFHEVKVFNQILSERSLMLSSILKLLRNDVLPKLNSGEIGKVASGFKHHSKERFNTYMSLMVIILESLWPHFPSGAKSESIEEVVDKWLSSQDVSTAIQDSQTNDVIYFLMTFIDRHPLIPELRTVLREDDDKYIFKGATRELLSDFRLLARHLGIRCPWNNERQLGMRLVDASDIMQDNGWRRVKKIISGKIVYEYTLKKRGNDTSGKRRKKKKGNLLREVD